MILNELFAPKWSKTRFVSEVLRIEDLGRKIGFPKAKTPARMLAFPGLRRIITQPILYAGGGFLSRKNWKDQERAVPWNAAAPGVALTLPEMRPVPTSLVPGALDLQAILSCRSGS